MKYGEQQSRQSSYYLVSLVFATAAWIMVLIAQALLTSTVGHEAVGALWFAMIIQFFVNVAVALAFYTRGMCPHRHQIANFSSMAVVLGVIGVDRTVYSKDQSRRAIAAGWIILSAVDILWVLHFSKDARASNDLSRALPEEEPLSTRSRSSSSQPNATSSQSDSPNDITVKNPLSPLPSMSRARPEVDREESVLMAEQDQAPSQTPNAASTANRKSIGDARDSSGATGFLLPMVRAADAKQRTNNTVITQRSSSATNASLNHASSLLTVSASFNSGITTAPSTTVSYSSRAQACWTYQASPADAEELSFTAGDILYVARTPQGKWWEARKVDGSKDIVPSNYLRLLAS
ncbi:uncharacterized protein BT62DRAFT_1002942 [Guyanagaster necrorhizus]|uniref:SH3 domain-containing protein n=1 Tax=Guyanagaster necrorhizus TaxID=856835 RepID=A0A9P8AVQ8_9AGAR|nr:uncharacterized protein BT62DRAFT_1002942 [Guyanagaster necrorhizus MCA 3950]KAG7449361.1 hypothetical protein BT62DRAFT_1002942 [Guyanagaster necrorhizus MCA 3950]